MLRPGGGSVSKSPGRPPPLPEGAVSPQVRATRAPLTRRQLKLWSCVAKRRPGSRRLWLTPQLDRSRGELGRPSALGDATFDSKWDGPVRVERVTTSTRSVQRNER